MKKVLDAHAHVVALRPIAVLPAERRVHVRLLAAGDGAVAVLVPQQRHRHAAPGQFRFRRSPVIRMVPSAALLTFDQTERLHDS
jgi:hypothetical protein